MKVAADQPAPRPGGAAGELPAPPTQAVRPLTPTEFNTAMVHLYRGEVGRANTWRTRLDGTTNWAVLTTGATLSFAFSSASNTHVMILINTLLIFFFMYIEARRYRFYDLWRSRVRLMETEFFAEMLTPSVGADHHQRWRELLAHDLLYPRFGITLWQALGRRLRRNYLWIFAVLLVSWVVKISIHPFATRSVDVLLERIAIGPIPAWLVLVAGALFHLCIAYLGLSTRDRAEDEAPSRQDVRERVGTEP